MIRLACIIALLLIPIPKAHGHGEDKPGPRGGIIRMPGSFHTEVIFEETSIKVYLLDFHFEDPITDNSSVSAEIVRDANTHPLTCLPEEDFFRCKGEALVELSGEMRIQCSRDGKKGVWVSYDLPGRK